MIELTTVEWLSRGKYAQAEIQELKETYWKGIEQCSQVPFDPVCQRQIEAYTAGINAAVSLKYKILNEITDVIQSLPDERHRYILFGLYITGQSIPQIAKELCISDTWVKELHKRALKEVEKIIL